MNKRIFKKHMKWYYQALIWRMCTASPSKKSFDPIYENSYTGKLSKSQCKKNADKVYKIFRRMQKRILSKPRTLRHYNFMYIVAWGLLADNLGLSVYPQVVESCCKAGGIK